MIPLAEVRVLDRNAEALGVPVADLMERAGQAVAEEVLGVLAAAGDAKAPVLVLAGPGHNGGDGLAAARHLARRRRVAVALPLPRSAVRSPLAKAQLRRLAGVKVHWEPEDRALVRLLDGAGVVVDALLGAGQRGPLREPYRTWVRLVNERALRVVSVDVPTGLGTDLAVEPDVTVALHAAKEGQDEANSGRIVVRDIGIPPRAATHTGPGELTLYPIPAPEQHKGQGGAVLVVGGGPYTGAPALAGLAALRAGADLAFVLAPARAAGIVASYSPSLIVRPLRGDDLDLEDAANRAALEEVLPRVTAACVGNGMGRAEAALRSVGPLLARLEEAGLPAVVDADAIHAVGKLRLPLRRSVVATPHAGEFQALTGEALATEERAEERAAQAETWARKLGCTLIVKGHASVIADGARRKWNSTGNPGMSHGGSGDVLAGIVAALLGKGLDPFDAARLGAWMAGRAGDLAFEEKRFGLLPTDMVEALPGVFREAGLHWRRGEAAGGAQGSG